MRWVALDPEGETVTDSRPISTTVNRFAIISPSVPARISFPLRNIAYFDLPPSGRVFSRNPAYFMARRAEGEGPGRAWRGGSVTISRGWGSTEGSRSAAASVDRRAA